MYDLSQQCFQLTHFPRVQIGPKISYCEMLFLLYLSTYFIGILSLLVHINLNFFDLLIKKFCYVISCENSIIYHWVIGQLLNISFAPTYIMTSGPN